MELRVSVKKRELIFTRARETMDASCCCTADIPGSLGVAVGTPGRGTPGIIVVCRDVAGNGRVGPATVAHF